MIGTLNLFHLALAVFLTLAGAFMHSVKLWCRNEIPSVYDYWAKSNLRYSVWSIIAQLGVAFGAIMSGATDLTKADGVVSMFLAGFAINSTVNSGEPEQTGPHGSDGVNVAPVLILFFLLFAGIVAPSFAATAITASCTAPTVRTDGAELLPADILGYKFYFDGPGAFAQQADCNASYPIALGKCITTAQPFYATTLTKEGESALSKAAYLSEEACNIPPPAPAVVYCTSSITDGAGKKWGRPVGCVSKTAPPVVVIPTPPTPVYCTSSITDGVGKKWGRPVGCVSRPQN